MAKKSSMKNILAWVDERNRNVGVDIRKVPFEECAGWLYDEESGLVRHEKGAFFSIGGIRGNFNGKYIEQPICYQPEIGYLGYLCARIDGEMCFLMQTKLEPGNINLMQLSPTIQATKSNFEQKHGGRKPAYLDIFKDVTVDHVIVNQLQSEQSSRFWGKRNSNIIIMVDDPDSIELTPNHKWVSLRQIKQLMKHDNLVNMSTRTVLAGIPFSTMDENFWLDGFGDETIRNSVMKAPDYARIKEINHRMVEYRMFNSNDIKAVPLFELENWTLTDEGFRCKTDYPFMVNFNRISIEGREVQNWCQPLFEAMGRAFFGLFCRNHNGVREYLLHLKPEVGCFDSVELGPTVQREVFSLAEKDDVEKLFMQKYENKEGVIFDTLLAEEGGRFYHEENRNVIIEIADDEIDQLPADYFWCDYATIVAMNTHNNNLNIQLRSMVSVLDL